MMQSFASTFASMIICFSATPQTNALPEEIFAEDEGLSLIQMRKKSHAEATPKINVAETAELMIAGDLDHKGENCWVPCNGAGFCSWCGNGNACCQGSLDRDADPTECSKGIPSTNAQHHECVAVTDPPDVEHVAEDCWAPCNGAGFCDWCGSGNACCQGSLDRDADPEECGRGIPSTNARFHECVAVTEAPPPVEGEPEHKGENCWVTCNGAGFCDWCGSGNACCQGSLDRDADPAECGRGIPSTNAGFHECVAVTEAPPPAEGEPQHKGENCWSACSGKGGFCDWCGSGNACCQGSLDRDADPAECGRGIPSTNAHHHECVVVTEAPPPAEGDPQHKGENCWSVCNGAGFCSWCGNGNACCQGSLDRDADPTECSKGIPSTNAHHHECVVVTDPPDVEHVAENCWGPCKGKGGFCEWCGSGNACCQGSLDRDADPEECGRGIFSTNADHHECVAVKDPPPPEAEPPAPPPPPPPPAPPAPCTTRKHSRFLVKECPGKKAEVIIRIAGFDASNIDARKQKVMDFFADAVAQSISRNLGIPLGDINIVFKNNVSLLQGFDIQQGGQLIVVVEVASEVLPAVLPELDEPTLLNDIKAVPDVEAMLAEGVDSLDAIFVVEQGDEAAAVGDPHLTTNAGKKFDLKT